MQAVFATYALQARKVTLMYALRVVSASTVLRKAKPRAQRVPLAHTPMKLDRQPARLAPLANTHLVTALQNVSIVSSASMVRRKACHLASHVPLAFTTIKKHRKTACLAFLVITPHPPALQNAVCAMLATTALPTPLLRAPRALPVNTLPIHRKVTLILPAKTALLESMLKMWPLLSVPTALSANSPRLELVRARIASLAATTM